MNKLEQIAVKKLKEKLYSLLGRCDNKNKDRMEHERIFLRDETKEAIDIVRAIEENTE